MTDQELLEQARERPDALGEFYDRYETASWPRSRPAGPSWRRGHEPTGWLFTIAHHKLADFHGSRAVDRRARRRLGIAAAAAGDEQLERVDEYRLTVHPVARGEGLPLMHGIPKPQRFALVSSTTYTAGSLMRVMRPARRELRRKGSPVPRTDHPGTANDHGRPRNRSRGRGDDRFRVTVTFSPSPYCAVAVDITPADGSFKVVELARFCITRRCGTVTPKLG